MLLICIILNDSILLLKNLILFLFQSLFSKRKTNINNNITIVIIEIVIEKGLDIVYPEDKGLDTVYPS